MGTRPGERFEALCTMFADRPDVAQPSGGRGFGSSALKVDGSIFAMLVDGRLVVKLPAATVSGAIADGTGEPFTGSQGRPMREWLRVGDDADWPALAEQARSFVAGDG